MKYRLHSHRSGEIKIPASVRSEVEVAVQSASIGPPKITARGLREAVLTELYRSGWSSSVALSQHSKISVTSINGTTGLCLQTGNAARIYADMMKLQKLYLDGAINNGVIILPSQPMALKLGRNIAHATRLVRELEIFEKVYSLPTLIFELE